MKKVDDLRVLVHELSKEVKFSVRSNESVSVRVIFNMTHSIRVNISEEEAKGDETVFDVIIFCPETGRRNVYSIKIKFILDMLRSSDDDLFHLYETIVNTDSKNRLLAEILCSSIVGEQSEVAFDMEELSKQKENIMQKFEPKIVHLHGSVESEEKKENQSTDTTTETKTETEPKRFACRIPNEEGQSRLFLCQATKKTTDTQMFVVKVWTPFPRHYIAPEFIVEIKYNGEEMDKLVALTRKAIDYEVDAMLYLSVC